MSGSGIQPWSMPGSKIRALKRPWTGIGLREDGETFVVYDVATSRKDATPALAKLAEEKGGRLIAALNGGHEERILDMKWGEGDGHCRKRR